jgi:transposase
VELVVERAAGLDVGKDEVVACLRVPGGGSVRVAGVATRRFAPIRRSPQAWRRWRLAAGRGVTQVVMEATGQYWKPIW